MNPVLRKRPTVAVDFSPEPASKADSE
jgi:hypothetical protein